MAFAESNVRNQVSEPNMRKGSSNRTRPVSKIVVFTDIDDTCYPTKSKPFYTNTKSGVFPGMPEFLLALSRGAHNHEPRPINVVSARAGNALQFIRIGKNSKISRSLQKAGGILGDVLYGKFGDQTTFIRGSRARRVALAERKAKNISQYMQTLTSFTAKLAGGFGGSKVKFTSRTHSEETTKGHSSNRPFSKSRTVQTKLEAIFCGDNGEGDFLAAVYMINKFPDMKAVFIHKVLPESKEKHDNEVRRKDELRRLSSITQLHPRRKSTRPKLLLYNTVAEAGMMAYRHGLVSFESLRLIYKAIVKSDLYTQHNPRRKSLSPRKHQPSAHQTWLAKTPDGGWVTIEKAKDTEKRVTCVVEDLMCVPRETVTYQVSSVEEKYVKRRERTLWKGDKGNVGTRRDHVKYSFEDPHKKQFFHHAEQLKRMIERESESLKRRAIKRKMRQSRSLTPPVSRRRRITEGLNTHIFYPDLEEETESSEDHLSPRDVSMPEPDDLTSAEQTPPSFESKVEVEISRQNHNQAAMRKISKASVPKPNPWRLTPARHPLEDEAIMLWRMRAQVFILFLDRCKMIDNLPYCLKNHQDGRRISDPVGLSPNFYQDSRENSPEDLEMIRRSIEFLQMETSLEAKVGLTVDEQQHKYDTKSPTLSLPLPAKKKRTRVHRSLSIKL